MNRNKSSLNPVLNHELVKPARQALAKLNLLRAVWDKRPENMYGVCRSVVEQHTMLSPIFYGRFTLLGWGLTHKAASEPALLEVVNRAREAEVIADIGIKGKMWTESPTKSK